MAGHDDTWASVAEHRLALADALDGLAPPAWDAPSLCGGWKVRDVVGHLVHLAEASTGSMLLDIVRQARLPMEAVSRIARREGRTGPSELVDRLRAAAGGRFVVPSQPPTMALGEVVVHGLDVTRPTGLDDLPLAPEAGRTVAAAYRQRGPVFGEGLRVRRLRFEATDAGWTVGPDDGPTAAGPAAAVLMALAGRPEGWSDLTGPGAEAHAAG